MPRKTIALGVVLAGLAGAAPAQTPDRSGPPPILGITREEIKPGRMAAHEKLNVAFVAALSKTPSKSYWLGAVPISGDDNFTLFLQAFGSFAEVESQRKADEEITSTAAVKAEMDALDKQGADLHASQRTSYARYRPELSLHPPTTDQVAQSRYFGITTVRVKPGRIPDYVANLKALNAAREKAKIPVQLATYELTTGGALGTFLIFRPVKSLTAWDDDLAAAEQQQKAITEALGGEEQARKLRMEYADIVAFTDRAAYALNPKISRPAPEFAKHDVAFWSPKPAGEVKALAVKKETKKEGQQ